MKSECIGISEEPPLPADLAFIVIPAEAGIQARAKFGWHNMRLKMGAKTRAKTNGKQSFFARGTRRVNPANQSYASHQPRATARGFPGVAVKNPCRSRKYCCSPGNNERVNNTNNHRQTAGPGVIANGIRAEPTGSDQFAPIVAVISVIMACAFLTSGASGFPTQVHKKF
jgi:hypothetical protein